MKKVNLTGKLSLKKETIAKLNDEQMNSVKGGETNLTYYCTRTCVSDCDQVCKYTQQAGCPTTPVGPHI